MAASGKKSGFLHWFWRVRYWITVVCLVLLGSGFLLVLALGDDAPAWSRRLMDGYLPWRHPETRLIWAPWMGDDIDWTEAERALSKRMGPVPGAVEEGVEEFRALVKNGLGSAKAEERAVIGEKRDYLLDVYRKRAAHAEQAIEEARRSGSRTPKEIDAARRGLEKLRAGIRYLETLPGNLTSLDALDPSERRKAEEALGKNPFE